jgi:hypothetical protein
VHGRAEGLEHAESNGYHRSHIDVASEGLALSDPTWGRALSEDTPQERTPWTTQKQRPCVETWREGERSGEQLWRVHDPMEREGTSSSVEPMCAAKGEGQAALTTKGGREWIEGAKGGQPAKEESGGCGGAAFLKEAAGIATVGGPLAVVGPVPAELSSVLGSGAEVGVTGAREELAEVSVALEPVDCVWCSFQRGCVWNAWMR